MTNSFDVVRFQALANAYGAKLSRWPPEEKQAAMLFAARPEAVAILLEAGSLDGVLDGWKPAYVSADLIERTVRAASKADIHSKQRLRIWWAGIGLAAALSGAVAGSVGAASMTPGDVSSYNSTLFGDVPDQED
jgi:hypothetical protein